MKIFGLTGKWIIGRLRRIRVSVGPFAGCGGVYVRLLNLEGLVNVRTVTVQPYPKTHFFNPDFIGTALPTGRQLRRKKKKKKGKSLKGKSVSKLPGKPKAAVVEAGVGEVPVAGGGPAVERIVEPGPATNHAARTIPS